MAFLLYMLMLVGRKQYLVMEFGPAWAQRHYSPNRAFGTYYTCSVGLSSQTQPGQLYYLSELRRGGETR
jgi:hypothetical protein